MNDWLVLHEPTVRLTVFVSVFGLMALWEVVAQRRSLRHGRGRRWLANAGLTLVDSLAVRLAFPAAATGAALWVEREGWGLLNHLDLAPWIEIVATVLVLDMAIYFQHVMFHAVPVLWRLHQVHHADEDLDVTTGVRFHPIEILVSVVIKSAVIAALGASPLGVVLFALVLNATSMFNHGNVRLAAGLDRFVRWIVVTPDMHRVHHSMELDESNSNFGFNLPWWDRLFGTYRAQPRGGHDGMRLGVEHFEGKEPRSVLALLALPFVGKRGRVSQDDRKA